MRVTIIGFGGANAVVQWPQEEEGEVIYYRTVLPASLVDGRASQVIELAHPEDGAPYGEPWADLIAERGVPVITAAQIANELHRMGIWTVEDLQARPMDALAAFQKGYGMDVQQLRQLAQHRRSSGK